MRTHTMVVLILGLLLISFTPLIIVCFSDSRPAHSRGEAVTSCACAAPTRPSNKFLIFWKEKDGDFKVSDKLFDSIDEAWKKAVPPGAAEVRIVTVRID